MEEKEITWGDVEIYIGGKKIEGIVSCDIAIAGSDCLSSGVFIGDKIYSHTGTINLSKKDIRKLRKACMVKKRRYPRKLKKMLKKERASRCEAASRDVIAWLDYYFPFGYRPPHLDKYLRCRCYIEPVGKYEKLIANLDKETSKLVVSTVSTLPRAPGNRPGYIIIDDLDSRKNIYSFETQLIE